MNRRIITVGLGLLVVAALAITAYRGIASPPQAPPLPAPPVLVAFAPPEQWNLPAEGWSVCRVGASEPIEGVGERQVFDLCHAQGWQLKTYCLDPGMPIPGLGAMCSQLVGGTYWCGEGVQQLGFVAVLQAAETATVPTATTAASATVAPTFTFTAPVAPQQQQTAYPPPEETAYPVPPTATTAATATTAPTLTSTVQSTQPPQQATATTGVTAIATPVIVTPTVRSTPYNRPAAGGPGNLDAIINGLGALGLAGGTLGLGLQGRKALRSLFHRRRPGK